MTSLQPRTRVQASRFALVAPALGWLALVLSACSTTHPPDQGNGETHFLFLAACNADGDCGNSLSCLCGVCTKICADAESCSSLDDDASCVRAADAASCERSTKKKVCSLDCEDDDDCDGLGASECIDGQCRAPVSTPPK